DVSHHTLFHRYVALGDSFTEGVGDPDPALPNGVRGWADRVAEVLATLTPDFGYANLAIRGRVMGEILDTQIEPALALRPDLVSLYAGGNDLLRPRVDLDRLVAGYAAAAARLTEAGAHLVLFTGFDLGHAPVFRHLRGRVAVYNEFVREIADRNGATLIDFWRMRDYRDARLWSADRLHMSTAGHARMAINVLDRLGVAHGLALERLAERARPTRREERAATRVWAREHLAPWVQRRLRGASSGDGLGARRPTLERP
ncbi:MAG: SGNH/GDSL hydrolase family protein, partial [Nocardioidaceae bacterium]